MRLTYLDEAGTSRHEPFIVISGVLVHGDLQLPPVEDYLKHLIATYIPEPDRPQFAFHATDIWSGKKYFKDRKLWPVARRAEILNSLADIPAIFYLPVVHGVVAKAAMDPSILAEPRSLQPFLQHASAFANATQLVERYFRKRHPHEYTVVVCEDRPEVRGGIKLLQEVLQGRPSKYPLPDDVVSLFEELPYRHIRDTVHFARKSESPMLQIADVCSFLIRRYLISPLDTKPFFDRIATRLVNPASPALS